MNIYEYKKLKAKEIDKLCRRNSLVSEDIFESVSKVKNEIIKFGDEAIRKLTERFDGIYLENFKVPKDEFEKSEKLVSEKLKKAIRVAKKNIWKFHEKQITQRSEKKIETTKGVFCWREFRAIESVGLYIPGGTAPLFSTILMLAIPALLAECENIVLCTPPNKKGTIAPEILWTAKFLGIKEIYKIGGSQAIFAMAYGTKQIPKVDKIFGPGNQYVTVAKMITSSSVAIDMPAGPSEVLVIANRNSNAKFIASDLLSQAEHGEDSQAILVCDNKSKVEEIISEMSKQLKKLPRQNIAKEALKKSFVLIVQDLKIAFDFSNKYAPEHLILSIDNFEKYLNKIKNAGSVFCGKYSAESFGDYASGTNHTLPTGGFAKSYSGISVSDFGKWITFQEIKKKGLKNLGDIVEIMANGEQLFAHRNAVTMRKQS